MLIIDTHDEATHDVSDLLSDIVVELSIPMGNGTDHLLETAAEYEARYRLAERVDRMARKARAVRDCKGTHPDWTYASWSEVEVLPVVAALLEAGYIGCATDLASAAIS